MFNIELVCCTHVVLPSGTMVPLGLPHGIQLNVS